MGNHISPQAFNIVSGLLFGTSLLSAIARALIRYKTQGRFFIDDAFLLLACLCLCAATGLLYTLPDVLYKLGALAAGNDKTAAWNYGMSIQTTHKEVYAFYTLLWTSIFAVKLSFLYFFRTLIWPLHGLRCFLWITVGITVASWLYIILQLLLKCPHLAGLMSPQCSWHMRPKVALALAATATALDILTDLMIITIPAVLLHTIQMRLRQKIIVGFSLGVSVFIIITTIIRATGLHIAPRYWSPSFLAWQVFWQYAEGCTAVIVLSSLTFRSIFSKRSPSQDFSDAQKQLSDSLPSPGLAPSPQREWKRRGTFEGYGFVDDLTKVMSKASTTVHEVPPEEV